MSNYGGSNHDSLNSCLGLISLPGEINAQPAVMMAIGLEVALPLLRLLVCTPWQECIRCTKMLLVFFHHPNSKNSRLLVSCPHNRHCTVMSLVVGNELTYYQPDMNTVRLCSLHQVVVPGFIGVLCFAVG